MWILGLSCITFMDSCIFFTKVIKIDWEYLIIKAETEGTNQKIIYLKNIQAT